MTKQEYINHIVELYRVANSSDTESAPNWIPVDSCQYHCERYQDILRDLTDTYEEYSAIINSI